MNVLFLCTGNSCRSILAEALLTAMAPEGVRAQSAGSRPAGYVHPQALAALREAKLSTDGLHSKSWDNLPEKPDIVITLCADAAGEACPVYLGNVARAHWGLPDPAKVVGDKTAVAAAFAETLAELRVRISQLVAKLQEKPGMSAAQVQAVVEAIAASRK